MLAIGRALMSRPRILLLDEPSLGLAPKVIAEIFEKLTGLKAQGLTICLVEQNAAAALEISDRAYVMSAGRVVASGTARDVMSNADVSAAYLGKADAG
jgi:branched-chain amino acid transport system ATP-binding protein